ncbi:hypothetical protein [Albidovulum sp.]|uniref:hypothetical protein n=1 Tax=Albidovulum sp. TaxID=1872424 RepID=UPI0039B998AD
MSMPTIVLLVLVPGLILLLWTLRRIRTPLRTQRLDLPPPETLAHASREQAIEGLRSRAKALTFNSQAKDWIESLPTGERASPFIDFILPAKNGKAPPGSPGLGFVVSSGCRGHSNFTLAFQDIDKAAETLARFAERSVPSAPDASALQQ